MKKRKNTSRNQRNIIIACVIIVIAIVLIIISYSPREHFDMPEELIVTVAWNPGSTADDFVRALIPGMDVPVVMQNIPGANGAVGADAVMHSTHDGSNLLSTSLSALVTSEAMGFNEFSHREFTAWLCAFTPVVIVVPNDSKYDSIHDLIYDIRENPGKVRCADSGIGTIGFTAAELLSSKGNFEIGHISFSGSSAVIYALAENEADFAVLLSTQAVNELRTGQIRTLGSFHDKEFIITKTGPDNTKITNPSIITVPAISGITSGWDSILPMGEYYGLFIPADTNENILNSLEAIIKNATTTDEFEEFMNNAGMIAINPNRNENTKTAEYFSSIINWTLYDAGFLPTNPQTLGIPRG